MTAPILEARNLCWGPPRRPDILRDISFALAEGEVMAICGANGAGKSSLLRLLYRHLPPRSGTVSLLGRDLWRAFSTRNRPHRRRRAARATHRFRPDRTADRGAWPSAAPRRLCRCRAARHPRGQRRIGTAGPRALCRHALWHPVGRREAARDGRPRPCARTAAC